MIPQTAKVQTAFRFSQGLIERMKWAAKKQNKSLNTFVEEQMEKVVGRDVQFPKLQEDFFEKSKELEIWAIGGEPDPMYKGLSGAEQAQLDKQIKYEFLMEKYGEGIR